MANWLGRNQGSDVGRRWSRGREDSRIRRSRSPRRRSRERRRSRSRDRRSRSHDRRHRHRSRSRRRSRSRQRSRSHHRERRRSRRRSRSARDRPSKQKRDRSRSRDRRRKSRNRHQSSESSGSRKRSYKDGKSEIEKENGKYSPDGPEADSDNHLVYRDGDILQSRFVILKTVGEGTFGKVVLCVDRMREQEKVALKIIKRVKKYYKSAKLEINVLKKIAECDPKGLHRCVRMIEYFDYHGFMCLSFEWLGQSVFDFLKDNLYFPYPIEHVQAMSYQLIDAVAFLHKNHITHTDLKPENILFVDSSYDLVRNEQFDRQERRVKDCQIKLIDFGSATFDDEDHTTIVSTRHYRALEVILELGWGQKCDVWSVGAIMFELYTGTTLFQTHNNLEHLAMMTYILGKIPSRMVSDTRKNKYFRHGRLDWDFEERNSSNRRIKAQCRPFEECIIKKNDTLHLDLFDIMRRLMEYDPDRRVSMREALDHSFFDSVREQYQVHESSMSNGKLYPNSSPSMEQNGSTASRTQSDIGFS